MSLRICLFYLEVSNLGTYNWLQYSIFYFCWTNSNTPTFISDFNNLSLLYFFLVIVVQSLCRIWPLVALWTAAHQASLSFSSSLSLLKLMSIESVMPSKHLTLCCPLLLLPSIFPGIRVFSNESTFYQVAKVLELQLQHQSCQRIFRVDLL